MLVTHQSIENSWMHEGSNSKTVLMQRKPKLLASNQNWRRPSAFNFDSPSRKDDQISNLPKIEPIRNRYIMSMDTQIEFGISKKDVPLKMRKDYLSDTNHIQRNLTLAPITKDIQKQSYLHKVKRNVELKLKQRLRVNEQEFALSMKQAQSSKAERWADFRRRKKAIVFRYISARKRQLRTKNLLTLI